MRPAPRSNRRKGAGRTASWTRVLAFRSLNASRSDRPIQERCPAADAGVVTGLDLTIAVLVVFAALAAPLLLGAGAVSLWRALRTS